MGLTLRLKVESKVSIELSVLATSKWVTKGATAGGEHSIVWTKDARVHILIEESSERHREQTAYHEPREKLLTIWA